MKKNREAKKAKKELESNNFTINGQVTSTTTSIKMELTDDPEKNKKIKKVKSVSIYQYNSFFIDNDSNGSIIIAMRICNNNFDLCPRNWIKFLNSRNN
jgi:hypothetical protein